MIGDGVGSSAQIGRQRGKGRLLTPPHDTAGNRDIGGLASIGYWLREGKVRVGGFDGDGVGGHIERNWLERGTAPSGQAGTF